MAIQLYARKAKGKYQDRDYRWSKDIGKARLETKREWWIGWKVWASELVPVEIRELPAIPKRTVARFPDDPPAKLKAK